MNIDFICLGVMKCGTTTLDCLLRTHPEISMPFKKELHFFGDHVDKGLEWYLGYFPCRQSTQASLVGEVATHYFAHPQAPLEIRDSIGNPQFLVLLRDPIERAYSHWKHDVMVHGVQDSFSDYFKAEEKLMVLSRYGACLRNYLEVFQLDHFLFLDFDLLVGDMAGFISSLAGFLNVDPCKFVLEPIQSKSQNVSRIPKFGRLYSMGAESLIHLERVGLNWVSQAIRSCNIGARMKAAGEPFPPLTKTESDHLIPYFDTDLKCFAQLSGCQFPWMKKYLDH